MLTYPVSATRQIRDKLHEIAQGYVYKKVSLFELEYQPDSSV